MTDTTSIIERIAFLDAMSAQLSLISTDEKIFYVLLVIGCIGFGVSIILGLACSKKTLGVRTGILSVSIAMGSAFIPADIERLTQASRIAAAVSGLPPSVILMQINETGDVSDKYIGVAVAASLFNIVRTQINEEKYTLERELASTQFVQSGELERLKKELLEKALKAKATNTASPSQLAIIAQSN